MSVRDTIKTTITRDNDTLSMQRIVTGDSGNKLEDYAVPTGTANTPVNYPITRSLLQALTIYADQALTIGFGGTNAVQTISMTGPPTAGTTILNFGGQSTTALAYNSTAAQVQTALQALSSVGAGGFTCTGGPWPGTPIVATAGAALAVQPLATITTTDSLTGGSSAVASTTTGVVPGYTLNLLANVPFRWDAQGYFTLPLVADTTTCYVTNSSGVDATLNIWSLANAH